LGYIIYWSIIDEMHILNLAVHPDSRRQGIGRSLLQEAMRLARRQNLQTAWLEVRPSNSAALALSIPGLQHRHDQEGVLQRYRGRCPHLMSGALAA
jgi:GNAT superfamily N-acetyltransferase